MASEKRSSHGAVRQLLAERPQRFEFFEAVRHLERLLPQRAPVGTRADPRSEVVRFRGHVGLAFPVGDVRRIRLPERDGERAELEVQFMGVAATQMFGSLPTAYAELILDEERERRSALRDFLDVFNHRFISLFYRSWRRSRLAIAAEAARESFFERALFSLVGLGSPALRDRLPLHDPNLLSRAGLLLRRPASAVAIESLLRSYFGVPVRIEPFVRTTAALDAEDRTRLGRANSSLGQDIVIGARVALREDRFRVHLGPLRREDFERFQAHGSAYAPLCSLIRLAIGANLEFDVQLELVARDVPRLELGSAARTSSAPPPRLGRSTWLLRDASPRNRGDSRVRPRADLVPSHSTADAALH